MSLENERKRIEDEMLAGKDDTSSEFYGFKPWPCKHCGKPPGNIHDYAYYGKENFCQCVFPKKKEMVFSGQRTCEICGTRLPIGQFYGHKCVARKVCPTCHGHRYTIDKIAGGSATFKDCPDC